MMGLNAAYFRSFYLQKPVSIEFHWYHDQNYLHHFEDPETILERFRVFQSKMLPSNVEISHVWNSEDSWLYANRYENYSMNWKLDVNSWLMRDSKKSSGNLIVIWRPTFNASPPRRFKRIVTHSQWIEIIDVIKAHGFDVIEIDYRTPIREAMYLIKICRATVSYEGMWHYISKNYCKPMVVLSDNKITKFHTPNALRIKTKNNLVKQFYQFPRMLETASDKANRRLSNMKELLNEA